MANYQSLLQSAVSFIQSSRPVTFIAVKFNGALLLSDSNIKLQLDPIGNTDVQRRDNRIQYKRCSRTRCIEKMERGEFPENDVQLYKNLMVSKNQQQRRLLSVIVFIEHCSEMLASSYSICPSLCQKRI